MERHPFFRQYQKSESFFWSAISLAIMRTDDVHMYMTGVGNAYLNPAIQKKTLNESNFQDLWERAQKFYASYNLPWVWVVKQGLLSPGLKDVKLLERLDPSSAMSIELNNFFPPSPLSDLVIKEDTDDLTDWGLSLRQAYQAPLKVSNQYIHAKKQPLKGRASFHHFVGYLDSTPVSCLTLSLQEDRARIDDVGTIPEEQHKGYATQMIVYALQMARTLGANYCFLEASQAGRKVYERIGFENIYYNLYFKARENV